MKLRAVLVVAALCSCALFKSTPEDTPPEAPNAREFRQLPPTTRDEIFPPPQVFIASDYLNRLVCPNGDPPATKLASHKGLMATYYVQCPSEVSATLTLDTAVAPPPPPKGDRLLSEKSYPEYRDAIAAAEKKDFPKMLALLDAALKETPGEPVYRRERLYALYQNGKALQALLDADDLLKEFPSAQVYRYRALAALQLGMRDAVMQSLDGIIGLTQAGNPMFAEAICTKGILLTRAGDSSGEPFMKQGCALDFQVCCDEIKARKKEATEADAGDVDAGDSGAGDSGAGDSGAGDSGAGEAGAGEAGAGEAMPLPTEETVDGGAVPVPDAGVGATPASEETRSSPDASLP